MITNCPIHHLLPNQCGSNLLQTINAPVPLVWSILRRFDHPQGYKQFIKSCTIRSGDGSTGSVRDINLVSGLPATTSRERLDMLDDDLRIMVVSIIGGDHKLANYHSVTTLCESETGKSLVTESYVVDIPEGSSKEDTCTFADTIIGVNLRSLASVAENMCW